jgi:hypothetical protein
MDQDIFSVIGRWFVPFTNKKAVIVLFVVGLLTFFNGQFGQ